MSDMIKTAAASLVKRAQAADRLSEYWTGLPEATKSSLLNALIGTGLGGALGGGAGYMYGDSPVKNALIGALLGGTAAGAGSLGLDMVRGNMRFPGERAMTEMNPSDRVVDAAVGTAMGHPLTAAGAGAGGLMAGLRWPTEGRVEQALGQQAATLNPGNATIAEIERIRETLRSTGRYEMPELPPEHIMRNGRPAVNPAYLEFMQNTPYEHGREWRSFHGVRQAAMDAAGEAQLLKQFGGTPVVGGMLDRLGNMVAHNRFLDRTAYAGRGVTSPAALLAILAGTTALGYMGDRYLKGQNQ